MRARALILMIAVLLMLPYCPLAVGGGLCTRLDDGSELAAWADAASNPTSGPSGPQSNFNTMYAYAQSASSGTGDGVGAQAQSQATESCVTAPGATSAAPQIGAGVSLKAGAYVTAPTGWADAQADGFCNGDTNWVPPDTMGNPPAPVTTLNGTIYLVATGGFVVTGGGIPAATTITAQLSATCNNSFVTAITQGNGDFTVTGVVGGVPIGYVGAGGLNDFITFTEAPASPQIPLNAGISAPAPPPPPPPPGPEGPLGGFFSPLLHAFCSSPLHVALFCQLPPPPGFTPIPAIATAAVIDNGSAISDWNLSVGTWFEVWP